MDIKQSATYYVLQLLERLEEYIDDLLNFYFYILTKWLNLDRDDLSIPIELPLIILRSNRGDIQNRAQKYTKDVKKDYAKKDYAIDNMRIDSVTSDNKRKGNSQKNDVNKTSFFDSSVNMLVNFLKE